jgi:O-antigen/teichoic acid export membrane protein
MLSKIKTKLYNFLRWTEQWTKTDMIYLISGSFWLNISQIISSIASFALAIAFANLIPAETYGTYSYILSFIPILSISALSGMNESIIRSVAKNKEAILFEGLKTKIKWGSIGSVVSIILSLYYYSKGNNQLFLLLLIISSFIPFLSPSSIWIQYLIGKKKYKTLSYYKSIYNIGTTLLIIATIYFTRNIFIIIFSYLIIILSLNVLMFIASVKKNPPNDKTDNDSISYGKHLSFISVIATFSKQADKIIIFHFLGPINLAIYNFAIRPVEQIKKPLVSVLNLSFPKFSKTNISDLKKSLPKKIALLSLMLLPIILLYILIAPVFYKTIFPQYTDSIFFSQLYALTILLYPRNFIIQVFQAHAIKNILYKINIIFPIIKISLLLLLTKKYGISGVIFSILITEIFRYIFVVYLLKNIKK